MPNFGSSITGGKVAISGAINPTIYHVPCLTAGVEYSQVLSNGTVRFTALSLLKGNLKCAFVMGDTPTKYLPVYGGASWSEEGLSLTGKTLYFQSDIANDTVIILEWT